MSRCLAVLAALVLVPAMALAGVRAEVSATVGDDGVAQVRRKVLASALTETLKTIINRHLPAEELTPRRRALSAIYKSTSKYISRYKIEAEGRVADSYRLSVVAEVDHKRLVSKLEELGFEPRRLGAKPRVLSSSYADGGSAALAAIVTERFVEGKISAAYHELDCSTGSVMPCKPDEVTPAQAEELSGAAIARARHIACSVSLMEEEESGEDGVDVLNQPPALMRFLPPIFGMDASGEIVLEIAATTPPEVELELKAGGFIVDALSGFLLGRYVVSATGRGLDPDAARASALNKLADALYQSFVAELTHASWGLPGVEESFEVRVEGVTSPAQIESVADALKALTEVEELSLARVEARTVVWRARGTDPGFGWAEIASHTELEGAGLSWQVQVPQVQPDASQALQNAPRTPPENPSKILLGRFAAP